MHVSHGAYIGIVIVLLAVLLLVFQLKRRMDEISDHGEMVAEDHLLHPEEAPEPTILPHVHEAEAEAAAPPAPPPVPEPLGPPDDLTRLKGLGPRAQARLNELGITRYDQIAAWSEADVGAFDAQMGSFAGRIGRDRWVDQARFLASGDTAGFEAAFGKLG